jgi:hypothetical protein
MVGDGETRFLYRHCDPVDRLTNLVFTVILIAAMTFEEDNVGTRSFTKPQHIIRCPYCVLGDEFRPMVQRPGWFVCEVCCHTVLPGDPAFKCTCPNCLKLHRAA